MIMVICEVLYEQTSFQQQHYMYEAHQSTTHRSATTTTTTTTTTTLSQYHELGRGKKGDAGYHLKKEKRYQHRNNPPYYMATPLLPLTNPNHRGTKYRLDETHP